MNNRGQSLVVFILILPLLIALFGLIIDIGNLYIEKRKVDNVVKESIRYGFNSLDDINLESKIKLLLNNNIDDISSIIINIDNEVIDIRIVKYKNSLFNIIIRNKKYEIKSEYKGYKTNDEIRIVKG